MGNQPSTKYQYAFFREDIPPKAGHSKELVCIQNKDHPGQVAPPIFKGCKTLWEGFTYALNKFPSEKFLGTRNKDKDGLPYEWKTFHEVGVLASQFARGMHHMKLVASVKEDNIEFEFMGIFSKNREEWAIVDIACLSSSVTIVPFFDSLGPHALSFVIN
jgi:long-chain acyl-CoA synthetase